ncbi:MAG TPA: hypothetical protein VNN17_03840 [Terriglobia bacterium]|nr:hypothetical protein [Terriglobia bacterium]
MPSEDNTKDLLLCYSLGPGASRMLAHRDGPTQSIHPCGERGLSGAGGLSKEQEELA